MSPHRDSRGRDPWRNDTAGTCCTGECEQGRHCPLVVRRIPAPIEPAPLPLSSSRPIAAFIAIAVIAVLCAMGGVDGVARLADFLTGHAQ